MFIHGVLLRSASRRRRRKMQGVDAGMQGVDDRMHAAYDRNTIVRYAACMQAACIRSVTGALVEMTFDFGRCRSFSRSEDMVWLQKRVNVGLQLQEFACDLW